MQGSLRKVICGIVELDSEVTIVCSMAGKMFRMIMDWLLPNGGDRQVQKRVEYSMNKYKKTYQLLEKYDKQAGTNPAILAKPKALPKNIRDLSSQVGI
jgi:hypothetical protein